MFKRLLAGAAILSFGFVPGGSVQAFVKQVPGSEFARLMEDALKGTRVYLHNVGRRRGRPVLKANASFIRWGKGVGRARKIVRFSLPELGRKVFDNKYLYYLNDIRSRRPTVRSRGNSFLLKVPFETGRLEFIGRCLQVEATTGRPQCKGRGVAQLPALHWANPQVEIDFVPIKLGDNLSMHVKRVKVSGGLEIAALCRFKMITPQLCTRLNRFTRELRRKVSTYLTRFLNSRKMKLQIARQMRQVMNEKHGAAMFRVRRVAMAGNMVWLDMGF